MAYGVAAWRPYLVSLRRPARSPAPRVQYRADIVQRQPARLQQHDQVIEQIGGFAEQRRILIHHRGQLSVYLRLNDIPVPSIYGPSADEGQM